MTGKRALVGGLALLASLSATPRAHADLIQAPGATWEYTFTAPTGSWETGGGTFAGAFGPAPFGNVLGGDFGYSSGTFWDVGSSDPAEDDLWVRRTFDTTGFDSIAWNLGVDNGYKLFIDGTLVASDNAEGYTFRWEYSGSLPALTQGSHWVAVALEDHGGLTAFDMQITGNPVPEPGTLTLMGLGLGLVARRTRRQKS
jgi:hypothetical protein